MSRVALLASEPVRPSMGGIGVRYVEMSRHLQALGFEVVLVSPSAPAEAAAAGVTASEVHRYGASHRRDWLSGCSAVVAQGQLANDLVLDDPGLPLVFDFYDPWLIENLSYLAELGDGPYRNDHRSWLLQLGRGDLILCASEEQRLFYLGCLAAVGRLGPRRAEIDPTLTGLVAIVPFGCTLVRPVAREPRRTAGERQLLFGGVYDWYDIETLVAALERISTPSWKLTVVRTANPESTPQQALERLEAASRRRGWWGERVVAIERVAVERHDELVASSELLVAPHLASLESELSFRTRFLDALAAGLPVVATRGGALARAVEARSAGWIVAERDATALAAAIDEILAGGASVDATIERGRRLASELTWPRVLAPLVEFLRQPQLDRGRSQPQLRAEAGAPRAGAASRLWRRARRRLGG